MLQHKLGHAALKTACNQNEVQPEIKATEEQKQKDGGYIKPAS